MGEAEENLSESGNKYRNLFETMTQGVVYHDAEGKVIPANPASRKILGFSPEGMLGSGLKDYSRRMLFEYGSVCQRENHPVETALKTGLHEFSQTLTVPGLPPKL